MTVKTLEYVYSPQPDFAEENTLVVPVFNQAKKIVQNLSSLVDSISMPTRMIVIDDASTDETLQILKRKASQIVRSAPVLFEVHSLPKSKFETKCDAFGFALAKTSFVFEIQADMRVNDAGFDRRLIKAMSKYPDLIALSGRGTEPLKPILEQYSRTAGSDRASGRTLIRHIVNRALIRLQTLRNEQISKNISNEHLGQATKSISDSQIFPDSVEFQKTGTAGWVGHLIETKVDSSKFLNKIWIGETIMRGPLIVDLGKYIEVGGLDTKAFFQGYDEHDLWSRANLLRGYKVGFSPINFDSPLEDGTTRKPRTLITEWLIFAELLKIANRRKKSTLGKLVKNPPLMKSTNPNEIRTF